MVIAIFFSFCFKSDGHRVGDIIDTFNGVPVYYNGAMLGTHGRNVSADGYNIGLKFQCVEFVKRYYLEVFDHKMPNSYGNAKDYYFESKSDVAFNARRGLVQYKNIRESKPAVHDILIYGPQSGNPYGHVAIITEVTDKDIEIIQQNVGSRTRVRIPLVKYEKYWTVADYDVLGWLRKN
jgi:surface antigen